MVGGYKGIFYKKVGKESSSTWSWWKNFQVQVGSLLKKIPNFICSNPTSTEVSSQDEETKVGPNGTSQEEETQTK